MSSEISELHKKEPLFFKTKWINHINDLIDQHNTQLDRQKHISGLNETEKKETQKKNFSTIIFNIFHHHRILFPSILRNSHARTTPGFSYRV